MVTIRKLLAIYLLPLYATISYVAFVLAFDSEASILVFLTLPLALPIYLSTLLYTVPQNLGSVFLLYKAYSAVGPRAPFVRHYALAGAWSLASSVVFFATVRNGYVLAA